MRRTCHAVTILVTALFLSASIGLGAANAARPALGTDTTPAAASATFEGGRLDLRSGWGQAHACNVDDTGVQCFRTEAQMDTALRARGQATADSPLTPGADTSGTRSNLAAATLCSSYVRLYDGTSYGGNVLNISIRFTFLSLAGYTFDNVTSSYKIGACDTRFYSGTAGGGTLYPGDTTEASFAGSMLSGWSNAVSSIYIM